MSDPTPPPLRIVIIVNPSIGQAGDGAGMADAALCESLGACGDHVIVITSETGPEALAGVAAVVRLRDPGQAVRIVEDQGVQAVLLGAHIAQLLPRLRHVPTYVLDHGGQYDRLDDQRVYVRGIVAAADNYVGPSWPAHVVVHPPDSPALDADQEIGQGSAVVLAGATAAKGADIFAEVARLLPDLPFVAIKTRGPALPALAALPNVRVLPKAIPEADLIALTRVLLCPSARESYGMAARLLALSGRPVVVTDLPGFRESCGPAAVYLPRDDAGAWAAATRRAWDEGPGAAAPAFRRSAEIGRLRRMLAGLDPGPAPSAPPQADGPANPTPGPDPAPPTAAGAPPRAPAAPPRAAGDPRPAPAEADRPFLMGFLKVRDEIAKGNLHRVVACLSEVCDEIAVFDDASLDGTVDVLSGHPKIPADLLLRAEEPDFVGEIGRKQALLDAIGARRPHWILWLDGDEVLDARGVAEIRDFLAQAPAEIRSYDCHEVNLWLSPGHRRIDRGFDVGVYRRIWRWSPDLRFGDLRRKLHSDQCPEPLRAAPSGVAPFEVLHYGNATLGGLRTKSVQYHGHADSLERHLHYDGAEFAPVPPESFPQMAERWPGRPPRPRLARAQVRVIESLADLRNVEDLFVVCLPAFNRADTIGRAIASVQGQSWRKWLLIVLDDGSTDGTADVAEAIARDDARIMVCRYPDNRGGVAVNELGMAMAERWGSWWTRLGSDDVFLPDKLANDREAFRAGASAVYGPYADVEDGRRRPGHGNNRRPAKDVADALLAGSFMVGWANVAVRSDVLAAVRRRFGSYVDGRLHNMEDFCFNRRVALLGTPWVWRAGVDGLWTVNRAAGASYDDAVLKADNEAMAAILAEPVPQSDPVRA